MCVIYGWDPICRMSEDWKQQMGIYNLPKKDTQPYYNVLAHDSSSRYAAQGIILTPAFTQKYSFKWNLYSGICNDYMYIMSNSSFSSFISDYSQTNIFADINVCVLRSVS